jgi:nucleotide-binding universal stress UspA family protein
MSAKKILIPVDDSKGARACVATCARFFSDASPEAVILLHVRQLGGTTLAHDRISDAELSTVQEDLQGTEVEGELERGSKTILDSHKAFLEKSGMTRIKTMSRSGHVADTILETAKAEGADLIIIGNTRSLLDKIFMGDVSKEVVNHATVPVLLAK